MFPRCVQRGKESDYIYRVEFHGVFSSSEYKKDVEHRRTYIECENVENFHILIGESLTFKLYIL